MGVRQLIFKSLFASDLTELTEHKMLLSFVGVQPQYSRWFFSFQYFVFSYLFSFPIRKLKKKIEQQTKYQHKKKHFVEILTTDQIAIA